MDNPNCILEVTIVRHGETDYNLSKIVEADANTDIHLNDTGIAQANLAGRCLSNEVFTRVISSGLLRANQTATSILSNSDLGKSLKLEIDQRTRERNIGDSIKGGTVAEWIMKAMIWSQKEKQPIIRYNPPGSETYEELKSRITSFFTEFCKDEETKTGSRNVLIVSHGIWIMTLMDYLTSSPDFIIDTERSISDLHKIPKTLIQNTAITKIRIYPQANSEEPRKLEILRFNDHEHVGGILNVVKL